MSNYNTLKTADTINAVSIVDGAITTSKLNNSVTTLIVSGGGPKATAITYPGNDLAADTAGGQTITVTGTGFVAGCSVFIGTTQASVVTVVSATSVTFTTPALAAATYTLYLVNPDGGTATIVPGISYSGTPTWTTGAGSLASIYEYSAISNTITATGDGSIVYSVLSGTLPTGSSLNTSTGVITGTSPASAGATTYTFVIRATDAQLQDTDRTFSITINTDAVTWTTPAANSTVTLGQSLASTTTLLATSAASNAITYTANTLPTGMSISGATVTGTPTVVGNTTSTFTATAATTNRTATAIINWTVSVSGDTYFPYTTLLLSGATATETFVADASTNNFAVTIAGDTKPNNFNPYTPGYYSNYFDGTGDYLSTTVNLAIATGPFTIEAWVYLTALGSERTILNNLYWQSGNNGGWILLTDTSNRLWLRASTGTFNSRTTVILSSSTLAANIWYHVAVVRDSNNLVSMYFNGVSAATAVTYAASLNQGTGQLFRIGAWNPDGGSQDFWSGYISNARVVVGTAVYTGTFIPSTTPLTAIANTSLLTCQSNRFLDNSTNAYAITKVGDTTVSPTTPFVPNTTYATYGSTYFDGTGDYLSVPNNLAFQFGTGNFTVEYWVNFTTTPGASSIIPLSCWSSNSGWELYYRSSTAFTWYYNSTFLAGTTLPKPNTWYHLAVTRSSGTTRLFVNGAIEATLNSDTTNFTPSSALYIGNESGSNTPLTGYLTDVRVIKGTAVYTTTFTPPSTPLTAITNTSLLTCQTNQPANNSVFLDSSTNALAVTRVGNTSAGTFTPYGANWSVYQSDVLSDQLGFTTSVGTSFQFTGNFTIEGWVYYTTLSGDASFYVISDGSTYLAFNISMSAGVYNIYLNSGSATSSFAHGISVGVWTHVAMVRSGSTVTLYTNGVSKGTITNSNTLGYSAPSMNRTGGGVSGVIRYISNVRIVKGTAVYTGNFTPSTTPLTAIANTVLLTFQSNRFVDNSTNAFVVTITGDVAVQRFSPFGPSAAYSAATYGGSAYFDGTGDYLSVPTATPIVLSGTVWTIECWCYLTSSSFSTYRVVINKRSGSSAASYDLFFNITTGYLAFYNGTQYTSSAVPIINAWNHIAAVYDGTNINLYMNGVRVLQSATTNPDNGGNLYIGADENGTSNFVIGYINDVRVLKGTVLYSGATYTVPSAPLTAVTNTSLLLNMTSAGIVDATMINDLETVGDAKILSTQTPYAGSYYSNYFNGSSNFTSSTSQIVPTGSFTVECWVYVTSTANQAFVGQGTSANAARFSIAIDSGLWWTQIGNASINTGTPIINTWNYLAVTFNGSTLTLYVNGTSVGTVATSTSAQNTTLTIGTLSPSWAAGYFVTGYISNVRVSSVVRTIVTPTAPYTSDASTRLLTCQSNRFVDNSSNAFALTATGTPTVQSFNPFQRNSAKTMSFDGTGDYLYSIANQTNNFGTGNFTVECWVYFSSVGNGQLVAAGSGTNTNAYYWQYYSSQLQFGIQNVGSITVTSWTPIANAWYHIAVVRSGTNVYQFVNGTQLGSTVTSSQNFVDGPTYVGYGGAGYLNGYINDLRITKGTARYTSTFTPPTTAFIAR